MCKDLQPLTTIDYHRLHMTHAFRSLSLPFNDTFSSKCYEPCNSYDRPLALIAPAWHRGHHDTDREVGANDFRDTARSTALSEPKHNGRWL